MKLSGAVEQGCCIMALLADPHNVYPVTNDMLAARMAVSPTYLKKLTRKLVVARLIQSTQGAGGGFVLARPVQDITLYEVVVALEGGAPLFQAQGIIERVFAGHDSTASRGIMAIQQAFDEAQQQWRQSLQSVTMRDLLRETRYAQ